MVDQDLVQLLVKLQFNKIRPRVETSENFTVNPLLTNVRQISEERTY